VSAIQATAPARRSPGTAPSPAPNRTTAPAPVRSRTPLSIVTPQTTSAGRLPFAVLVGGVLLAGLMSLLLLHTMAAQDGFRVHDLNQRLATLQDQEQQLQVLDQQAGSPTALRTAAAALGMRPSTISSYRTLKDGRVVGIQTAVPIPVPVVHHAAVPKTTKTAKTTKTTKTAKTTKTDPAKTSTKAPATTTTGHAKAPVKAHSNAHSNAHSGASAH
jgi:hypothetical protein